MAESLPEFGSVASGDRHRSGVLERSTRAGRHITLARIGHRIAARDIGSVSSDHPCRDLPYSYAPPDATQVHVHASRSAGMVSATDAPVTASGPAFETSIV